MRAKYCDIVEFIKKAVKLKHVSISTDAWALIANEGYVTYTIHLISWTLHHFLVGIFKKDGA